MIGMSGFSMIFGFHISNIQFLKSKQKKIKAFTQDTWSWI